MSGWAARRLRSNTRPPSIPTIPRATILKGLAGKTRPAPPLFVRREKSGSSKHKMLIGRQTTETRQQRTLPSSRKAEVQRPTKTIFEWRRIGVMMEHFENLGGSRER